jgi:hypothetical protein
MFVWVSFRAHICMFVEWISIKRISKWKNNYILSFGKYLSVWPHGSGIIYLPSPKFVWCLNLPRKQVKTKDNTVHSIFFMLVNRWLKLAIFCLGANKRLGMPTRCLQLPSSWGLLWNCLNVVHSLLFEYTPYTWKFAFCIWQI